MNARGKLTAAPKLRLPKAKWEIVVIDGSFPTIVPIGGDGGDYENCFQLKDAYEGSATPPLENTVRAAMTLCNWMNGYDDRELRQARLPGYKFRSLEALLVHPHSKPLEWYTGDGMPRIYLPYERAVTIVCCLGEPDDRITTAINMVRHLEAAVPPRPKDLWS